MNFATIAFPAIGTGVLKYPSEITAGNMIKSIQDYLSKTPSSTIVEVKIVLFSGVSGWQDIEQVRYYFLYDKYTLLFNLYLRYNLFRQLNKMYKETPFCPFVIVHHVYEFVEILI